LGLQGLGHETENQAISEWLVTWLLPKVGFQTKETENTAKFSALKQ
jgi:hypothetical protein